jgi:hypothetical protein
LHLGWTKLPSHWVKPFDVVTKFNPCDEWKDADILLRYFGPNNCVRYSSGNEHTYSFTVFLNEEHAVNNLERHEVGKVVTAMFVMVHDRRKK